MDSQTQIALALPIAVVLFGAVGTFLLLPHRRGTLKPNHVQVVGGILTGLSIFLYARFWSAPSPYLTSLFFYLFGFAAIAGAVLTITSRNPVYSALWFASVVLSTSGLFFLAQAQFLAVGTVIVYAGAIIVTFLFVIMLAQMEGRAIYDRAARSPFGATLTCFMLFWALLYSVLSVSVPVDSKVGFNVPKGPLARTLDLSKVNPAAGRVLAEAVRPTALMKDVEGRPKAHVAGLGETLFTDHLITVELAGALLFVALIGALSIATPKPPIRPTTSREATA